ncbi:MAG: DUF1232 domain-containing protein [Alphaproteobacteria bacterium]|nr:DUF1232 domain-containing protein [Alphaproteobacteria bacterium]
MNAIAQRVQLTWMVATDRRVPWIARGVVLFALSYLSWTYDFIPDDIPIIGHLDEIGIVLSGFFIGWLLIPRELIDECWQKITNEQSSFPIAAIDESWNVVVVMTLFGLTIVLLYMLCAAWWPETAKWIQAVGYVIVND